MLACKSRYRQINIAYCPAPIATGIDIDLHGFAGVAVGEKFASLHDDSLRVCANQHLLL